MCDDLQDQIEEARILVDEACAIAETRDFEASEAQAVAGYAWDDHMSAQFALEELLEQQEQADD